MLGDGRRGGLSSVVFEGGAIGPPCGWAPGRFVGSMACNANNQSIDSSRRCGRAGNADEADEASERASERAR